MSLGLLDAEVREAVVAESETAEPALVLDGLVKSFGSTRAVRSVGLELAPGELLAILGPSGCGKSTLLRLIAGLERPDAGRVLVGDRDVTGRPAHKRRIALVPQEGALFPHLTVAQNVSFGLPGSARLFGLRRAGERPEVQRLLKLLHIDDLADRMPAQISGGQAQRVALARALACDPELVLLDEPFSALDASLRQSVRTDIRSTLRQLGVAAIVVTHDQEEALSLADRVAVMQAGRIVQVGAPDEIYRAPADSGIAQFVGNAVVLPGFCVAGCVSSCLGDITVNALDGAGSVMLRPEQILVLPPAPGLPSGEVELVTFFGHDADVQVRLDSGETVIARIQGDLPRGRVSLQVRGAGCFYPAA
ncbi:ABC transporter ATP-binding protein [Granulicoccus sp. GXG6511]|uniref:ABC transporter ATP-binding protein n=1 Tax=Granulicoccus sp. GXG6511 TaxID=3381351 RepID=UPI003D7ED85F